MFAVLLLFFFFSVANFAAFRYENSVNTAEAVINVWMGLIITAGYTSEAINFLEFLPSQAFFNL